MEAGELDPSRTAGYSYSFTCCGYKQVRLGLVQWCPWGKHFMAECLELVGLIYASSGSGRIALVQDLLPVYQVCAIRTENAQEVWQSHPDTAELQHHHQGRTKALGISEKSVSANSRSPTINPVGLWSFKGRQCCMTTLQFQICFTNIFPNARTMRSLLECGTAKINTALDALFLNETCKLILWLDPTV